MPLHEDLKRIMDLPGPKRARPATNPRLALEQIVHLLSEAHANLSRYSYRDLVELTCRLERIASDALYPDPEIL